MNIGFVNPWALWLAGGAAAPIIIHLLMRRRPRTVKFPLVRLIQRSQSRTLRRNRLRYLLLLLLRMALIAVFALILARPVPGGAADRTDMTGVISEGTAAAVIVLDDSLSMRYRMGDVTWFDVAQEQALKLLERLPPNTAVGVLTTSPMSGKLGAEPGTAGDQVAEAEAGAGSSSCWNALENAGELLRQQFASRNVFLFTDMTAAAWSDHEHRTLDMGEQVDLYVVDCATGIADNGAVYDVYEEGEPAIVGARLRLKARIAAVNAAMARTVQFEWDGSPTDRRDLKLAADEETTLEFPVALSEAGHHWGRLSFLNPDNLAQDDARTFTVDVTPAVHVLVVEDDPASGTGSPSYMFRLALNPWGGAGRGIFRLRRADPAGLADALGEPAGVVALVGAGHMQDETWQALGRHVAGGGGLFVFLGPETGDAYRTEAATELFGAEVLHPQPAPPQSHFRLRTVASHHPVIVALKDARANLGAMRFRQYVEMEPSENAARLLSFERGRPALIITQEGGRVAVFASPADDRWGRFATVREFVPFCHEMVLYLAGRATAGMKSSAVGEDVAIACEEDAPETKIYVTRPGAQKSERLTEKGAPGQMLYRDADVPGYYATRFQRGRRRWQGGFAVNTVPIESRLGKVPFDLLKKAIRARKVVLVTDVADIELQTADGGPMFRELTPLLILMAMVMMLLESLMANRFYKRPATIEPGQEEGRASPTAGRRT